MIVHIFLHTFFLISWNQLSVYTHTFDIFLEIFIKQNIFWLAESLNARIFKKFYDLGENKNWKNTCLSIYVVFYPNYFRITFCSDLMRKRDIDGWKFVCVGVEILVFSVLLKVICNWFCAPIIFKNPLKTSFSIRNILLQFVSGWIVIRYFLFEKQTFNGYWYTKIIK